VEAVSDDPTDKSVIQQSK